MRRSTIVTVILLTAASAAIVCGFVLAENAKAATPAWPKIGHCANMAGSIRCTLPRAANRFAVAGTMSARTATPAKKGPWHTLKGKSRKGVMSISVDCGPNSGALSAREWKTGTFALESKNLPGFTGLLRTRRVCHLEVEGQPPYPLRHEETKATYEVAWR